MQSEMRAQSVADFPGNIWGSFSAGSLVIWAPQVAGGGRTPERPLRQPSKVWLIKPGLSSWFGVWAVVVCVRATPGGDRVRKGHKLISQSVAF